MKSEILLCLVGSAARSHRARDHFHAVGELLLGRGHGVERLGLRCVSNWPLEAAGVLYELRPIVAVHFHGWEDLRKLVLQAAHHGICSLPISHADLTLNSASERIPPCLAELSLIWLVVILAPHTVAFDAFEQTSPPLQQLELRWQSGSHLLS